MECPIKLLKNLRPAMLRKKSHWDGKKLWLVVDPSFTQLVYLCDIPGKLFFIMAFY